MLITFSQRVLVGLVGLKRLVKSQQCFATVTFMQPAHWLHAGHTNTLSCNAAGYGQTGT